MHVTHLIVIDCSGMTSEACSDLLLLKLQHGPAFKLRTDNPTDTVHGSLTIAHNLPPEAHAIIVEVYEQDSPSVPGGRRSTLKRPAAMPTAAEIRRRLNT